MSVTVDMDEVVRLCRQRAPKGIGSWPEDILRRYLTTRHDRGELALVANGPFVVAMGVAEEVAQDCIHIVAVIGKRRFLPLLWRQLRTRWPEWWSMRITAIRRGIPVEYQPARLHRHLADHER